MNWFENCHSRLLVDSHISDCKPEYLSKYSAKDFARLVKESGVESCMVYACDHNGNCYYPTKVGHPHGGLNGRDNFGDTVACLRREGIVPIAYYTATYHNDCAKRIPEARLIDTCGRDHQGRYHFTCPNQPKAVEFYKAQIAEILQYDVEGIFIDMSFWPTICLCDQCRKKFGKALPPQVDWDNPAWVEFQRFREKSMADFALELTAFAKSVKPGVSVTHQFSPVLHGWMLGQSNGIALASDYASGDFYGGRLQQRFGTKVFQAFSTNAPFEFMTSRCVNLRDHTSSKCNQELLLCALTTLANGGAYFFIDAINPDGTLEEKFYKELGDINRKLAPFRQFIEDKKPRLSAEVGIYFSMESCVERHSPIVPLEGYDFGSNDNMIFSRHSVLEELLGTSEVLTRMHVPYRVVCGKPEQFKGLKVLLLNNMSYLSESECQQIRQFVAEGGTLIASNESSLFNHDGKSSGNFQLADVFGVDFTGEMSPEAVYTGSELIYTTQRAPYARARKGTEVQGYLSIPDFPANDPIQYASIHSNPPGITTEYPAITLHKFGKGRCLWIAASFIALRQATQQEYAKKLLRNFLPDFTTENCTVPEVIEITKLEYDGGMAICIVNQQDSFPVLPLCDVCLEFHLDKPPASLRRISNGQEIPFDYANGKLKLKLGALHIAEFIAITL